MSYLSHLDISWICFMILQVWFTHDEELKYQSLFCQNSDHKQYSYSAPSIKGGLLKEINLFWQWRFAVTSNGNFLTWLWRKIVGYSPTQVIHLSCTLLLVRGVTKLASHLSLFNSDKHDNFFWVIVVLTKLDGNDFIAMGQHITSTILLKPYQPNVFLLARGE